MEGFIDHMVGRCLAGECVAIELCGRAGGGEDEAKISRSSTVRVEEKTPNDVADGKGEQHRDQLRVPSHRVDAQLPKWTR